MACALPGILICTASRASPLRRGLSKTDIGNHSCVVCSEHSTTLSPAGSSEEACVCLPGFQFSPALHTCEQCPAGLFQDSTSDSNCSLCVVDVYCPAQSVEPVACPYASASLSGAKSVYGCACNAGFTTSPSAKAFPLGARRVHPRIAPFSCVCLESCLAPPAPSTTSPPRPRTTTGRCGCGDGMHLMPALCVCGAGLAQHDGLGYDEMPCVDLGPQRPRDTFILWRWHA